MSLEINELKNLDILSKIGICCTYYEQVNILKLFTNYINNLFYELYLYNIYDTKLDNYNIFNYKKKKYIDKSYFIINIKNFINYYFINDILNNYNYYLCLFYSKSEFVDVNNFNYIIFYKNSFRCRNILFDIYKKFNDINKKEFFNILTKINYKWIILDLSDNTLYYLKNLNLINHKKEENINTYSLIDIIYYK